MFWTKGERVYDPNIRDAYNCKWVDEGFAALTCELIGRYTETAIARERAEPTEIVCYPPGNGMERHLDGPHRSHSIVYFLNSGYGGGELTFDSGEVFRDMAVGSAVVWQNGPEAWHASLPITSGFKWVVVSWVRHPNTLGAERDIHAQFRPNVDAQAG
ncbi:2OG-Fe(II) oxygenase [Bradyrhizobium ottawaense]|uniref:2OG-Fe(II) oxygenase n=1 Tax=Bradyrhizobium ottawaense TaxID=931866 RepID=UPI00384D7F8A